MARDERGQVVPLVAVLLVVVGALAIGLVRVADRVAGVAAAQSAADATALAAVTGGHEGADEVARANGAVLTAYEERDDVVTVTVRRDDATATASARWVPIDGTAADPATGPDP